MRCRCGTILNCFIVETIDVVGTSRLYQILLGTIRPFPLEMFLGREYPFKLESLICFAGDYEPSGTEGPKVKAKVDSGRCS